MSTRIKHTRAKHMYMSTFGCSMRGAITVTLAQSEIDDIVDKFRNGSICNLINRDDRTHMYYVQY